MTLRRLNRKVKSSAAKGKPKAINKHYLKTETKGNKERSLHATKGWRTRTNPD